MLYTGPGGSADAHAHHAIQLIRSLDSEFTLHFEDRELTAAAALVPSGLRHRLECESERLVVAFVEPTGPRGAELDRVANERLGRDVGGMLPEPSVDSAGGGMEPAREMLDALLPSRPAARTFSPHVAKTLAHLETTVGDRPSLADTAAAVNVSPSRLTHLFTEEVGIPFRNYVLWMRFRRVVDEVARGSNLTEAAIAAGFSDSSHLSRSFREHFGLSPSALLGMTVADGDWPD